MSGFRDRVALITGAGSGIGKQLALMLAGQGARIAALDRQREPLEALSAALGSQQSAHAVADVTDLAQVRAAVRELEAKMGPADLLIASAGIGRKTPAETFSAEEINAHIQINLIGVVNSIDAVLPGMLERKNGQLVVLSSLASYRGLPFMAGYCASKAGVNALFDSLRIELRSQGIAVTTLCPGWIRTPMTAHLSLGDRDLMTVEAACGVILDAIQRRKGYIAFPSRLAWQLRLLKYLPRPLSDWLTSKHMKRARKLMQDG